MFEIRSYRCVLSVEIGFLFVFCSSPLMLVDTRPCLVCLGFDLLSLVLCLFDLGLLFAGVLLLFGSSFLFLLLCLAVQLLALSNQLSFCVFLVPVHRETYDLAGD